MDRQGRAQGSVSLSARFIFNLGIWQSGNLRFGNRQSAIERQLEIANRPLPVHCQLGIAGPTLPDCPIPTLPMNSEGT
jgi:hypothetical protein